MPRSPHDRLIRSASVLFDVIVIGSLISIRRLAQPGRPPDPGIPGLESLPAWWWRWGSICDWTLFPGADAGNWAANVQAVLDGTPLDPHRPPVHALLVAVTTPLFGDITFAGHMVNYVLSLLVCVLTYALGRTTSGRGAATGAALLVALCPHLIESQRDFGIDASLQCAVMVLALLTWWAAIGSIRSRVVAGIAVGVAAGTHFLAMLMAGPAILLLVLSDPWKWQPVWPRLPLSPRWRRRQGRILQIGRSLLRHATDVAKWGIVPAVGFVSWKMLSLRSPPIGSSFLVHAVAEGVRDYSGHRGGIFGLAEAAGLLVDRFPNAFGIAMHGGLDDLSGLPWPLVVGLFCLGLAGPGLRRHANRWNWDWRPGLWLAVFILPTVALAVIEAPFRYSLYSLPLFFLAFARGLASLGAGVDVLARRRYPRWPSGLVAVLACAMVVAHVAPVLFRGWTDTCSNADSLAIGLYERKVGTLVRERFGPGECVVTRSQAVVFYADRRSLRAGPCSGYDPEDVARCLDTILEACPNDEVIPYVRESYMGGFGDQISTGFEALVSERFEPVASETAPGTTAWLYGMERAVLAAP